MPKHIPINTDTENNIFTVHVYGEVLAIIDKNADKHRISRSSLLRLILSDYMRELGISITSEDMAFFGNQPPKSTRNKPVPGKRNEVKMNMPTSLAKKLDELAKKTGKSKSVIMSYAIKHYFKMLGEIFPVPVLHL